MTPPAATESFDEVVEGAADEDAVAPGTEQPEQSGQPELSGSRFDDWWDRLTATPFRRRLFTWAGPVVVTIIAIVTRFWHLGSIKTLIFDETFYVKDAWTQWHLGYAASWPADFDPQFAAGKVNSYLSDPSFVVHPQLGKYLIGLSEVLGGGANPFAWRASTALAGVAAVILLMVIAKRLFGSTSLAVVAGLLFAIDGNAIVLSRVAILDNWVMFFALLGFYFILLDRSWAQRRLGRWIAKRRANDRGIDWGPALWWRPWLIAAGIAFGMTSSVKWSGLYFLAVFAVYSVVSDAMARRRAGAAFWISGTIFKQGPVTFLLTVPVAAAVYMTTWISWFVTPNSYERQWANAPGNAWTGALSWVPRAIQSFIHYEHDVYNFNISEASPHPYQANPVTWLLMVRPTSMYYQGANQGQNGCTVQLCGSSITDLANPLIWWGGTVAVLFLVYRFFAYREWRVGIILTGMVAGYVPWLQYTGRTVFQFYTIAFEPYMILALTFAIGLLLGSRRDPRRRRTLGLRWVIGFFAVAILISIYFWPLWTGVQLDYWYLRSHWWLPSWR